MGETISRRRGRLYYDRGETLLRSRGDFRMGETISRDTGIKSAKYDDYDIASVLNVRVTNLYSGSPPILLQRLFFILFELP